jgi:hypothetical protein
MGGTIFWDQFVLLVGYVRSDVNSFVIRRPRDRVDISLSVPWEPSNGTRRRETAVRSLLIRVWLHDASSDAALTPGTIDIVALLDNGETSRLHIGPGARNGKPYPRLLDPVGDLTGRSRQVEQPSDEIVTRL